MVCAKWVRWERRSWELAEENRKHSGASLYNFYYLFSLFPPGEHEYPISCYYIRSVIGIGGLGRRTWGTGFIRGLRRWDAGDESRRYWAIWELFGPAVLISSSEQMGGVCCIIACVNWCISISVFGLSLLFGSTRRGSSGEADGVNRTPCVLITIEAQPITGNGQQSTPARKLAKFRPHHKPIGD